MGIDKLKLAGAIKICMLGFYLIYFIFFNTSLIIYLPENKNNDVLIKKNLIGDYCILIIGGSNVRQGISAKLISKSVCPTLNLGVNGELGKFDLYIKWLEQNLDGRKYDSILYSPALFWYEKSIINESSNIIKLPEISIFTQLKNFTMVDPISIFNSQGDINNYVCNSDFLSFSIKEENFSNANILVSQELNRRISEINSILKAKNLYVRVPPVYIKNKKQAELYTNLMNKRIEILKEFGVKVISTTIVSTDSSLFCDSFHPNAKGREVFSKEIILP